MGYRGQFLSLGFRGAVEIPRKVQAAVGILLLPDWCVKIWGAHFLHTQIDVDVICTFQLCLDLRRLDHSR